MSRVIQTLHGLRVLRRCFRFDVAALIALILMAAAVRYRDELTREQLSFDAAEAGSKYYSYSFNDAESGGSSTVHEVRPLEWRCTLPATYAYPYCGFGLLLDMKSAGKGVDLSKYDRLMIDLEYDGGAEFLRLIVKNHRPRYVQLGPTAATQASQTNFAVRPGRQLVETSFNDFAVSDWWKEQSKLPDQNRPEFDNITAFEFVAANPGKRGVHQIKLRKITFERTLVSTEVWFGTIAACWAVLILIFVATRKKREARSRRQLAGMTLNSVPEVIWSVGRRGFPDFVSQQWSEIYGGDPNALLGRGWLRHIHRDDLRNTISAWNKAAIARKPFEAEFRARMPDGSYRWALARARPEFDAQGNIARWYGTCTDAHERVVAVEALQASERLHRGFLEASADCICILSKEGNIEFANAPGLVAAEIDSLDSIKGRHWSEFWQRKSRAMINGALARARAGETVRFRSFCRTAKGNPRWWDVVLTPMPDEAGAVKGLLAICRDVTSEREKSEQLKWASEHDALTSLPNRRAFQARLQSATLRAMITGENLGLMLIDLDHF